VNCFGFKFTFLVLLRLGLLGLSRSSCSCLHYYFLKFLLLCYYFGFILKLFALTIQTWFFGSFIFRFELLLLYFFLN